LAGSFLTTGLFGDVFNISARLGSYELANSLCIVAVSDVSYLLHSLYLSSILRQKTSLST